MTIYYPARKEMNSNGQVISLDAQPDTSGAPYPLILTETSSSSFLFQTHLVTHGYVMAQIQIPDHKEYEFLDFQVVDWPRDFLFVLDQVADAPPEGLENIIDTARTGVTGYSYGGDISLALSGARIDPDYYLSYCSQPPSIESLNGGAEWYYDYNCSLADKWDEFSQFVGSKTTKGDDGLPEVDYAMKGLPPKIKPGATLSFEIELLEVLPPKPGAPRPASAAQ